MYNRNSVTLDYIIECWTNIFTFLIFHVALGFDFIVLVILLLCVDYRENWPLPLKNPLSITLAVQCALLAISLCPLVCLPHNPLPPFGCQHEEPALAPTVQV
jgi:hypothetical protein